MGRDACVVVRDELLAQFYQCNEMGGYVDRNCNGGLRRRVLCAGSTVCAGVSGRLSD